MVEAGLVLLGFCTGLIGSLTGVGGGFFVIPFLIIVMHVQPVAAIGTSFFVIAVNSLSGAIGYAIKRCIVLKTATVILLASVPASIAGTEAATHFFSNGQRIFYVVFSGVCVAGFVLIILETFRSSSEVHEPKPTVHVEIGTGLLSGAISSLVGVGGGIINVPSMIYLMKFPPKIASGTSHLLVVGTVAVPLAIHIWRGNINMLYALLLGGGVLAGANLGVLSSSNMEPKTLKRAFAFVLLFVAATMLMKFCSVI